VNIGPGLIYGILRYSRTILQRPCYCEPSSQVRAKAGMAAEHDPKRGVHPLSQLKPGTIVILQDECSDPSKQWRVAEQYGQQAGVSDGRRILIRNRRHVREYYTSNSETERRVPLTVQPAATYEPSVGIGGDITGISAPTATLSPISVKSPHPHLQVHRPRRKGS
jgi:hypothetical protein